MPKKFVAKTKNGFAVYVDTHTSHAATHLQKHPELFDLMKEIITEHEVTGNKDRFETDTGNVVGTTDLVDTNENDDVFYARRINRKKYTRFVFGKKSVPTTFITIDLREKSGTEYEVYTVYIGRIVPSFPSGKEDSQEYKDFWKTHALMAENQDFLKETVTRASPWD